MNGYWDKAREAAEDARILSDAGRSNGAASRVYYAMFNAARAFLDARTDLPVDDIRRHSAVLSLFSQHAVRTGFISAQLNAALNKAFEVRAVADYSRGSVTDDEVRNLIALMDEMLQAVEAALRNITPKGS